jgi:DNA processing protein
MTHDLIPCAQIFQSTRVITGQLIDFRFLFSRLTEVGNTATLALKSRRVRIEYALDSRSGRAMSNVAIRRTGDPTMLRHASKYVPPSASSVITLSEALLGTARLPIDDRSDVPIYYAGDLSLLKLPSVAIVGTRKVSHNGIIATEWLTRKLVDAGIVIVSGLAYGVDTVAHQTAIDHAGKTIAVIGTPLDKASPSENARLQERIYREHLLLSRFKIGEQTLRTSFPLRNRLMAALSDATVVVEASDTSGTLHQAAECTKLGRWLFIAKSVVDDPGLSWPQRFLKYETCIVLERVSQITDRVLRSSQ